jgi:hypothetical protein
MLHSAQTPLCLQRRSYFRRVQLVSTSGDPAEAVSLAALSEGQMLLKALSLSSIIVLSLVGTASAGEDSHSANAIMPGCRGFLSNSDVTPVEAYEQGYCAGILEGLGYEAELSERVFKQAVFCVPEHVTREQELRVIVTYIDKHPEKMHQHFAFLAIMALRDAWPCKD